MINERIISDEILRFHGGRLTIYDNIFNLHFPNGDFITGDLNGDISREYYKVDSDILIATVGKSLIYSEEFCDTYLSYRLIELLA